MGRTITVVGYGPVGGRRRTAVRARPPCASRSASAAASAGRREFPSCDALDADSVRAAIAGASQVVLAVGFPYFGAVWRESLAAHDDEFRRGLRGDRRAADVRRQSLHVRPPRRAADRDQAARRFRRQAGGARRGDADLDGASEAGRLQIAAVRAPDFYGPGVGLSWLGDTGFGALAKGKAATIIGSPDMPHDFAYVPDFARAVVTLLDAPDDAFGQAWHVPCAPTRTSARNFRARRRGDRRRPRVRACRSGRSARWVCSFPPLREMREMSFQWDRPYRVDSSRFAKSFWSDATPFEVGAPATALSFRRRARGKLTGCRLAAELDMLQGGASALSFPHVLWPLPASRPARPLARPGRRAGLGTPAPIRRAERSRGGGERYNPFVSPCIPDRARAVEIGRRRAPDGRRRMCSSRTARDASSRPRRPISSRTAWANTSSTIPGRRPTSARADSYYPKLQVARPFTPVTGRRLLVAQGRAARRARGADRGAARAARGERRLLDPCHFRRLPPMRAALDASRVCRAHRRAVPFPQRGLCRFRRLPRRARLAQAQGDQARAARCARRRRDDRSADRRRHQARALGFVLRLLHGHRLAQMGPALSDARLLRLGSARRWPSASCWSWRGAAGAISRARSISSATDAIYGRNWGAIEERPFLHFEVCYYQAIEYAIRHGYKRVEAGAQGEHKLARGYRPVATHSAHEFADPSVSQAIRDYLSRERAAVDEMIADYEAGLPFRKSDAPAES